MRIPIEGVLDLHAFAPRDVASVVEEYMNEAHAAGITEVRLIHGRGVGVQRGIVQQALERHPLVAEFWDDATSHLGATICRPKAPLCGDCPLQADCRAFISFAFCHEIFYSAVGPL